MLVPLLKLQQHKLITVTDTLMLQCELLVYSYMLVVYFPCLTQDSEISFIFYSYLECVDTYSSGPSVRTQRSHCKEKKTKQKKARQNKKETSASSLWLFKTDGQSKRKKWRATVWVIMIYITEQPPQCYDKTFSGKTLFSQTVLCVCQRPYITQYHFSGTHTPPFNHSD